jgi:hypothetical protein
VLAGVVAAWELPVGDVLFVGVPPPPLEPPLLGVPVVPVLCVDVVPAAGLALLAPTEAVVPAPEPVSPEPGRVVVAARAAASVLLVAGTPPPDRVPDDSDGPATTWRNVPS